MKHLALLETFLSVQQGMADMHPLLAAQCPVALVEDSLIGVYDIVPPQNGYVFIDEMPGPEHLPKGFLASVELPVRVGRMTLVVAPSMLESSAGLARLIGAAARCNLVQGYQTQALQRLGIRDPDAVMELQLFDRTHDTSWLYRTLISALQAQAKPTRISRLRQELHSLCTDDVWAMVTLNEWREGLPRFLENRIRSRLGLDDVAVAANPSDPWTAPDESLTVAGGAALTTWLESQELGLADQPLNLLEHMLGTEVA